MTVWDAVESTWIPSGQDGSIGVRRTEIEVPQFQAEVVQDNLEIRVSGYGSASRLGGVLGEFTISGNGTSVELPSEGGTVDGVRDKIGSAFGVELAIEPPHPSWKGPSSVYLDSSGKVTLDYSLVSAGIRYEDPDLIWNGDGGGCNNHGGKIEAIILISGEEASRVISQTDFGQGAVISSDDSANDVDCKILLDLESHYSGVQRLLGILSGKSSFGFKEADVFLRADNPVSGFDFNQERVQGEWIYCLKRSIIRVSAPNRDGVHGPDSRNPSEGLNMIHFEYREPPGMEQMIDDAKTSIEMPFFDFELKVERIEIPEEAAFHRSGWNWEHVHFFQQGGTSERFGFYDEKGYLGRLHPSD